MSDCFFTEYLSPIGKLTLVSDRESLVGLWIQGQKYFQAALEQVPEKREDLEPLSRAVQWLDRYFAGEKTVPWELPLDPWGSYFQKKVWKVLCAIPYGEVTTYGEIASKIAEAPDGRRTSPRAVGSAVAHNPISIIIPCHRVIGSDGSLTGYAGGLERKKMLLKLEGALTEEQENALRSAKPRL